LINFTKEESNLQNDLEGWLYVLKNMSSLDKLPTYLRKPVFEKLFKIAEYSKLSKEEKEMYDVSLKRKWDAEAVRQYQVQELAEAEKKARQEERAKADGEKRSIVRNLIEELRLTDDAIVRIAGVPLRFVQEVRANFEKTK